MLQFLYKFNSNICYFIHCSIDVCFNMILISPSLEFSGSIQDAMKGYGGSSQSGPSR